MTRKEMDQLNIGDKVEVVNVMNANKKYEYVTLKEKPELIDAAADWFHQRWGVPR